VTSQYFVIVVLQNAFGTKYAVMFMKNPRVELHVASSNGTLVYRIETEGEIYFCTVAMLLFYFFGGTLYLSKVC
jgi:hypothetical protein